MASYLYLVFLQKAEELGWKDKLAMKVDARNPYRYAPNGLTVVKVRGMLFCLILNLLD